MRFLSVFLLVMMPQLLGAQESVERGSIPGEYMLSIQTAFNAFSRDKAKEGYITKLKNYEITYRVTDLDYWLLPDGFDLSRRMIQIRFSRILTEEERNSPPIPGIPTGSVGNFIVDIDTQEVLNTVRYFL